MNHREEWHLQTKHIGRRVLHFGRIDSTNTFAATLANDPTNDGVVILADEQTAGRGQPGRTWSSPPGSGVWMSVLLFPSPKLRRAPVLTALASVAVCLTISEVIGEQAIIKWPNDVLIRDRKVCGILTEQSSKHVVAGIGLNVNQARAQFDEGGLPNAGSLAMFTGEPPDRLEIASRLIRQLDDQYAEMLDIGLAGLEQKWRLHLGLIGKFVEVEGLNHSLRGTLRDVSFERVELESPDGATLRLKPETIRHLHAIGT